jgi:hypothetical protein
MSYSEAQFQSAFNIWKFYHLKQTCAEELKVTTSDKFYLSEIANHQLLHLNNVNTGFFQFKIPDLGNQNPFDSFSLYKVPAFVGIMFYKPRQPKVFYMIPIVTIQGLLDDCKKSITEEEAKKLALIKGELK